MRKLQRTALAAFISGHFLMGYGAVQAQQPATPADPVEDEATVLQELVVTGEIQYRDRTDTTAPELVYDQEFFAKFEPVSVGDQLRRVPGVAFTSDIGESDAPQMRGLGQGFTQVLVNGRPIPGAGNDRTVFVDRIPAEIIDRIEIVRSPSADIDSQGVGGTINIILKDGETLPPGVIARVGATYDVESDTTRGNGSLSWSGRNDAETMFFSLTVDAQERYNRKDVVEEVFEEDSAGFDQEVERGGMGRSLVRYDDPENSSAVERVEEDDFRNTKDLSFNGDVTFKLSEDASLRLDTFLLSTERDEHQDTRIFEGDGSVGGLELDDPELEFQDADFNQDSVGFGALYQSYLGDAGDFEAQLAYSNFTDDSIEDTFEETPDGLVNREDSDADDTEWTGGISLKRQMQGWSEAMGIESLEAKFGLWGKMKDRDYSLVIGDDLGEDDFTVSDSRFRYEEQRLDAFAVLKWELTPAVVLETGLRAESTSTEQSYVSEFFEATELEETVSGEADSDDFMLNPSAHLQWKLTDEDQLRFSVARTVRRPSIDQLVPSLALESPGDEDVTIGNPNLDFETSIGFDIGYEHRIGRHGIFGVNLFSRSISDLIGLVNTGDDVGGIGLDPEDFPGGLYTFRNLGDADVRGVEFDLSTPLDFIGMAETGVFANYTRLHSERDDPAGGGDIAIDYQPDYVYNVGITQNIPSWEASAGLSYQKQGESRFVTFGEIESQKYDGNLELFLEKRIGENVVVRLTGNNLLDASSLQAEAGFDGDSGAEILENQAAYDVDAFEVERERSSPRWTLTLRVVF
jgi:outer membrane receptor for ferrienterochelin and colicins